MTKNSKAELRRDQILNAAEKVFAEKGFHDATISDVARKANLSDATIYEYFPSKEDLLFSIPEEEVLRGGEQLEIHLRYIRGATGKIRSIIYHLLSAYQSSPTFTAVIMLILKTNRRFLETPTYQTIRKVYQRITAVIEEGVASGEFKSDINPYLVRSAILGTIDQLVTRSLLLGKPEDLLALVDPITDLILGGIRNEEHAMQWDISVTVVPHAEKKVDQVAPSGSKAKGRKTS